MGRVCYVPSLLWAEFVMCRVDPTPLFSVIDLNKFYTPYTGERRRRFTQVTGQLAPLRFAP